MSLPTRAPCLLVLALGLALLAPAAARAATVSSDGTTITYAADAGRDDVVKVTVPVVPTISEESATLTPGAGCAGGGAVVTCVGATRVVAALGDGNDVFDASAAAAMTVTVDGGPGADLLTGGGGADALTGGPGVDVLAGGAADQLFALDGTPDRLSCAGGGTAQFDPADANTGCAGAPDPSLTDRDGDGAPPGQDCDDANPMRYLGAPDFPSNGVDEDCDGADDINLDVDGDGYKVPDDCNDRNPAIKPNAVEKRGNKVDENCDKRLQDVFPMDVLMTNSWAYSRTQTRVNRLIVRGAPKRARITVRCQDKGKGCPFKRKRRKVSADNRGEDITRWFKGARLRPGAQLRIGVTADNFIAVKVTLTVRSLDIPALKRVCREGKQKAKPC